MSAKVPWPQEKDRFERTTDMNNVYESPLSSRYASAEMLYTFSADMKFSPGRRRGRSLARAEMALGLPITQEQVDEMAAHLTDIDYDVARAREKEVRHDVMAHVYTFGKAAPKALALKNEMPVQVTPYMLNAPTEAPGSTFTE